MKVAAKRIAAGKWGCNSGQACISPDYIVTTKSLAPKLVLCYNDSTSLILALFSSQKFSRFSVTSNL
jgi:aldehyde dehydrogenase (NAD+)